MTQLANAVGSMAGITGQNAPEFERRGAMLAEIAFCVLAAAKGDDREPGEQINESSLILRQSAVAAQPIFFLFQAFSIFPDEIFCRCRLSDSKPAS